MKQTAVEFLVKEFSDILGNIKTQPMEDLLLVDAINKAKAIEKEQIMDAYDKVSMNTAEQYYTETYGE
jgi:hypothetical protein